VADYRRSLDLEDGRASVGFRAGGCVVRRQLFVSGADDLLVVPP